MTMLNTIGYILLFIVALSILVCIIVGLKVIVWFGFRPCKHCGNTLNYMGSTKKGDYLFYCPHCGTLEQVSCEEFVRDCDKDCNPNV